MESFTTAEADVPAVAPATDAETVDLVLRGPDEEQKNLSNVANGTAAQIHTDERKERHTSADTQAFLHFVRVYLRCCMI